MDLTANWSKLQRVALKIEQDLLQAVLICANQIVSRKTDILGRESDISGVHLLLLNTHHFLNCVFDIEDAGVFSELV